MSDKNKVIAYSTDVGVSIVIPSPDYLENNTIEDVASKDVPAGKSYKIIDVSELPTDGTFRNAWELTGDKITVNKTKAVELTKERLRNERKKLLNEQDVLFQRALETGADTSAIVAEKERLRDVTDLATTSLTLEQLKALNAA